jgi:hypothetical protein
MKLIDRGIFQKPNGYWWAWSNVQENRCYSLHTKDRAKAQEKYDRWLAELREYVLTKPAKRLHV